METRFNVSTENKRATIAHVDARGFQPERIERADGVSVLVFAPMDDARLSGLAGALPVHFSTKLGIVVGDAAPFGPGSSKRLGDGD